MEVADALGAPVGGRELQLESGWGEEQMAAIVAPWVEHQDESQLVWNLVQAGPVVAGLLLVLWDAKCPRRGEEPEDWELRDCRLRPSDAQRESLGRKPSS